MQPIQQKAATSMNGAYQQPAIKRVIWTDDEARDVAVAAFQLLAEASDTLSSVDAVRHAQADVLPPERHRAIRQQKDLQAQILPVWKGLKAKEGKLDAHASPPRSAMPEPLLPPHDPLPDSPQVDPMQSQNGLDAAVGVNIDAPRYKDFDIAKGEPEQETLKRHEARETDAPPFERQPNGKWSTPHTSHPRRTMVYWTDDEKVIVARESKRLLFEFSDMKQLDAIRKAVFGYLPDHRQREIHTMGDVKWIIALWTQIDTERLAEDAMQQAEDAQRKMEVAQAEAAREREQPAPAPNLFDFPLDELLKAAAVKFGQMVMNTVGTQAITAISTQAIGAIGEQIQEGIMRQVVGTLQGIAPGALPEGTTRLHIAPRERKPRITIVGLLNQQAEDVKHAYADSIDFTFIKSQQTGGSGGHGGAGMLARGAQADVVISMVDFTGHDVDAASKHLAAPFVRVNGSVSALKRWLSRWLNGEVALASNS